MTIASEGVFVGGIALETEIPPATAVVIEISDSSPSMDRTIKMRIYARAAIPAYWIINLLDRRVEVYTDPTGPGEAPSYRSRRDHGPGELVSLRLGDREAGRVAVDDLLP